MPQFFPCISWYVEHFKKSIDSTEIDTRCNRVVQFIKVQDPDIIGLYEINRADTFHEIAQKKPNSPLILPMVRRFRKFWLELNGDLLRIWSDTIGSASKDKWIEDYSDHTYYILK